VRGRKEMMYRLRKKLIKEQKQLITERNNQEINGTNLNWKK
jgi:hypothetical protein